MENRCELCFTTLPKSASGDCTLIFSGSHSSLARDIYQRYIYINKERHRTDQIDRVIEGKNHASYYLLFSTRPVT